VRRNGVLTPSLLPVSLLKRHAPVADHMKACIHIHGLQDSWLRKGLTPRCQRGTRGRHGYGHRTQRVHAISRVLPIGQPDQVNKDILLGSLAVPSSMRQWIPAVLPRRFQHIQAVVGEGWGIGAWDTAGILPLFQLVATPGIPYQCTTGRAWQKCPAAVSRLGSPAPCNQG